MGMSRGSMSKQITKSISSGSKKKPKRKKRNNKRKTS